MSDCSVRGTSCLPWQHSRPLAAAGTAQRDTDTPTPGWLQRCLQPAAARSKCVREHCAAGVQLPCATGLCSFVRGRASEGQQLRRSLQARRVAAAEALMF